MGSCIYGLGSRESYAETALPIARRPRCPGPRPRRAQRRGRVIFYADVITGSIRATVDEVERRRKLQTLYNAEHGIEPTTIIKPVRDSLEALYEMDYVEVAELGGKTKKGADPAASWSVDKLRGEIAKLRDDMLRASSELRFEEAAKLRDRLRELEQLELAR